MCGQWELVLHIKIATNSHNKNTLAFLGHPIVNRIENLRLDPVARFGEHLDLILQQVTEVAPHHPRDIFHNESFGTNFSQSPRKLQIQLIDPSIWIAYAALAKALAGIAPYQQLGGGKVLYLSDISKYVVGRGMVGDIYIERIRQDVICHEHVKARADYACIASATSRKKRNRLHLNPRIFVAEV